MWPKYLDLNEAECAGILRKLGREISLRKTQSHPWYVFFLELEAYSSVVNALRGQGDLNKERRKVLSDLSAVLNVSIDRHKAEIRRAVNDELLNTVAAK